MGDFENPILSTDPLQPQTTALQAVALGSGDVLALPSAALSDGWTSPIIDVRQWSFLNIYCQPNNLPLFVELVWYADNAGTFQLNTTQLVTQPPATIIESVANFGPYVQARVFFFGAGADLISLWIGGRTNAMSHGIGGSGADPTQELLAGAFLPLPAGITTYQVAGFVQSGWATMTVQADQRNAISLVVETLARSFAWVPWTAVAALYADTTPAGFWYETVTFAVPSSLIRLRLLVPITPTNIGVTITMAPTP